MGCKRVCHYLFISLTICLFVNNAWGKTPKDGKYYFDSMKLSIIEIIDENQALINRNPDGSMKNKKLTPKAIYRKTYDIFKKITGAGFSPKSLVGEHSPEKISHTLAALLQGGRVSIAKSQKIINKEKNGSIKLKKFIPAVFGRLVAERLKQKTGIEVKQTSIGKGEFKARNIKNLPDKWEEKVLAKFEAPKWKRNKGIGEKIGNRYRYLKPIYIKKACLTCHGAPIGEKDPYGHTKEGYKIGDIRGGISVSLLIEE